MRNCINFFSSGIPKYSYKTTEDKIANMEVVILFSLEQFGEYFEIVGN